MTFCETELSNNMESTNRVRNNGSQPTGSGNGSGNGSSMTHEHGRTNIQVDEQCIYTQRYDTIRSQVHTYPSDYPKDCDLPFTSTSLDLTKLSHEVIKTMIAKHTLDQNPNSLPTIEEHALLGEFIRRKPGRNDMGNLRRLTHTEHHRKRKSFLKEAQHRIIRELNDQEERLKRYNDEKRRILEEYINEEYRRMDFAQQEEINSTKYIEELNSFSNDIIARNNAVRQNSSASTTATSSATSSTTSSATNSMINPVTTATKQIPTTDSPRFAATTRPSLNPGFLQPYTSNARPIPIAPMPGAEVAADEFRSYKIPRANPTTRK